jgi:hypothetical protein
LIHATKYGQPTGFPEARRNLVKDGQWRSFPNVPCLLQYVSNGNYYGRIRVNGKLIRESLKTGVWSTAKLRLAELIKSSRENRNKVAAPKFSEAVKIYQRELDADANMKPGSKEYRRGCILKLQKTWPELWELPLDEIKPQACKDWAAKLHKEKTGVKLENPAMEIKRVTGPTVNRWRQRVRMEVRSFPALPNQPIPQSRKLM